MSIAEIERFAADLKSNEALRAEAVKALAETSMVAFAASKGYPSVDRLVEVLDGEIISPAQRRFAELLSRKAEQVRLKDI